MTVLRELRPGAEPTQLYSPVRSLSIPKWILAAITDVFLVSFVAFGRWTRALGVVAALAAIGSLSTLKRVF